MVFLVEVLVSELEQVPTLIKMSTIGLDLSYLVGCCARSEFTKHILSNVI